MIRRMVLGLGVGASLIAIEAAAIAGNKYLPPARRLREPAFGPVLVAPLVVAPGLETPSGLSAGRTFLWGPAPIASGATVAPVPVYAIGGLQPYLVWQPGLTADTHRPAEPPRMMAADAASRATQSELEQRLRNLEEKLRVRRRAVK